MGELFKRTQQHLIDRRENVLTGGINSIPSPFKRFREDFIGIEHSTYYCVTSFTKGGKTQFTLHLLFDALLTIVDNPGKANLKVFYFPLEESDEKILLRFESYLLLKLDRIRISPKHLKSSYNDKPVPQEILDKLQSEPYQRYIKAFEEHFEFHKVGHPTGIYKICKEYAITHGTVHTKKYKFKNDFGEIEERDGGFDYYVPDNPNEFVVVVADHLGLVSPEGGLSLKESLDRLSKYFVELRDNYGMSPIAIQQQSTVNESNDSIKLRNIRPSSRGLSDSTYIGRDVNVLLGVFSPFRFGLKEYCGYDITKFRDAIRFLEVCVNRDGECGGLVALYFDGATCTFKELPRPTIEDGSYNPDMDKWYAYLQSLKK